MNKRARGQVARATIADKNTPDLQPVGSTRQVLVTGTAYEGQIPPPDLLAAFDQVIPGTSARIIQWAEDEQQHRRRLEIEAQTANISAQQRQLDLANYQHRAVFRSDIVGQVLGFIVCAGCTAGAFKLALAGQTTAAVALCAIPTAAVVQAFRANFFTKKG